MCALLIVVIYGAIGRFGTTFVQPFIMSTARWSLSSEKLTGSGNELRAPNGWISWHKRLGRFVDQRTFYHNEGLAITQDAANASAASCSMASSDC